MSLTKRTFLKQEVAEKLYPNSCSRKSAMQQMRNEIKALPKLEKRLNSEVKNVRLHYYTINQLRMILKSFSISFDEYKTL